HGVDFTMRSGWPNLSANSHESPLGHFTGGGMSFMSPAGAPESAQRRIVSICASDSDASFSKCWMPTVLSRCHGGMVRAATRVRIARAQGRVSSYVTSDIGAIESGRWQAWHFCWKIGATSRANVGDAGTLPASAAYIDVGTASTPRTPRTPSTLRTFIAGILRPKRAVAGFVIGVFRM